MYGCLVFFPLLGSVAAGLFGRYLGYRGAVLISSGCVILSAVCSGVAFYEVALSGSPCYFKIAHWMDCEMFDASWGFMFDSLTVVMCVVITFVSSLVHIYSISYMWHDAHLPRFMSYLSIFTFFMLMLVTADNFIQMFFGWEGVGLASYLLINFWFTRIQANKSAIKAMLMNRVGDFGLALGIMGIFFCFRTVDFVTVFASVGWAQTQTFIFCNMEVHALTCICILLFIGAIGKSAQLGRHTWLPDAMEGPTPVSALIHAATMVTAGVFLLARCSILFEYAPQALMIVAFVGAMTCFFAATTGVVQNDMKRVIAYSTCSQLGYMIFACGLSCYSVGVLHLMNHAFFKALLFLSAGSVIHAMSDEQDMRRMGGLAQLLPFTYAMMLIGSLSLVGFPFLTGFYSKDMILELAAANYSVSATFAFWLGTISVAFTSYYSFRLLALTFLTQTNASRVNLAHVHDAPLLMAIPLLILAFGSIFVGYMARDMMIGMGTPFWGNAIYVLPHHVTLAESEFGVVTWVKMLPLLFTISGAFFAFVLSDFASGAFWGYHAKLTPLGVAFYTFFNKRWLIDQAYNQWIGWNALHFGYHISFRLLDKGTLEILGPFGIARSLRVLTSKIGSLQSGFVYHYAFLMVLSLTVFVTFVALQHELIFWVDSRLYILFAVQSILFFVLV